MGAVITALITSLITVVGPLLEQWIAQWLEGALHTASATVPPPAVTSAPATPAVGFGALPAPATVTGSAASDKAYQGALLDRVEGTLNFWQFAKKRAVRVARARLANS